MTSRLVASDVVEVIPSAVSVEESQVNDANDNKPSPLDFSTYLPWAVRQMCLNYDVALKKVYNEVPHLERPKERKSKISHDRLSSEKIHVSAKSKLTQDVGMDPDAADISITVNYQTGNTVEGLVFNENREIPLTILKIITLILKYHPFLRYITISKGLNSQVIYELSKMLKLSNLSEVKLDGTYVENYDILLDDSKLKLLSLSKCSINDVMVKKIAKKLTYPAPAHQMLMILNLSTNRITDKGAEALGYALGRNMKLSYLNLAGNIISDKGANSILDSMLKFPLTAEEIMEVRAQNLVYSKHRTDIIANIALELWLADHDKKKDKTKKPVKGKGQHFNGVPEKSGEIRVDIDPIFYEKAKVIAETRVQEFEHPFNNYNTFHDDGYLFSKGNHTLVYLNLAYNNLSNVFVQKLLDVLQYQRMSTRKPKGLVNVVIEGIPMAGAPELYVIDKILTSHLTSVEGKPAIMKRRFSLRR